jgi:hypothetical protein
MMNKLKLTQKKQMKPLKETKLGKFLGSKGFDTVLETVGTVVPGVKVLDIVKDMVIGPGSKRVLTPEDRDEFLRLLQAEQELLETMISDTKDARNREVQIVKTGGKDIMHSIVTIFFLVCFGAMIIRHMFFPKPLENFSGIEEVIKNIVLIIAGYYFGSSSGSRLKTKLMSGNE